MLPPSSGWDWAAKVLDFRAPASFFRGAPGGEPIAIPTIEQAKARNIAFPTPGNNKEALKAIRDRTAQDADPAAQQKLKKGMKCPNPKDAYVGKQGKCAEFRVLGGKTSPPQNPSGTPVEVSLQLTSLIPKGDSIPEAPYEELDTAAPSSASSRSGASSYSNLSRQEHWRGLRHKRTRPEVPRLDAPQESAAQESSASSDWMGWRGWSEWKK